jgi:FK506-binding nuclear protein
MLRPWSLVLLAAAVSCGDAAAVEEHAQAAPAPAETGAPAEELEEGATGVRELKDGLVVDTTVGGRGHAAQNGDRLRLHYEGRVAETGLVFASTSATGIPYAFVLGRKEVIPAWELALRGARAGSEHKLTVPASLAYAEKGMGAVPADAALEFDVRIVAVETP